MGEPHELRLKPRQLHPSNGTHKAASGDSGTSQKRAELPKGAREAAQVVTKDNQMILVLDGPHLKARWVRARDLKR